MRKCDGEDLTRIPVSSDSRLDGWPANIGRLRRHDERNRAWLESTWENRVAPMAKAKAELVKAGRNDDSGS
jgi:hypothetical protein